MRMMLAAYTVGDLDINRVQDLVRQDTDLYAYSAVAPWDLQDVEPGAIAYLRYAALQHIIARHSMAPTWVKTHSAIVKMTEDVEAIPVGLTKRAVYIVRDPRDVAVSLAEHLGIDHDGAVHKMAQPGATLDHAGRGVYQVLSSWSYNVRSWLDLSEFPVMYVRYEDMLRDPEKALTKVLEWVGQTPDPERVRGAVDMASFGNLRRQEQEEGFKEKSHKTDSFFTRGTAGHWPDHLTTEQAEQIVEDHREIMERLSYLQSETEPA